MKLKFRWAILCLAFCTLSVCYGSLLTGSFATSHSELANALLNFNSYNSVDIAIIHLRLPRLLAALFSGALLSFAGYLIQLLVNNPIADPYTLGTASGAALGANLALSGILPLLFGTWFMPPGFAFAGALAATWLARLIAGQSTQSDSGKLLMAGLAVSSFLNAIVGLITFLSDSEGKLRNLVFWILGSFDRATDIQVWELFLCFLLLVVPFSMLHKQMGLLLLGPAKAQLMGLNINRLHTIILLSASLATAMVVSVCGIIGFVGLLVPHLVRSLFGAGYKHNLILSAWVGGLLLALADLLARLAYPPAGLPIGIVTSFAGIPFFVYLLIQKRYKFN